MIIFIACIGGIHEIPMIKADQEALEPDNGTLTIDEIAHVIGLKKCDFNWLTRVASQT